jgi:NADH-quinone oxidoreductase subunit J
MFEALNPFLGTLYFSAFALIAITCAVGMLVVRHPLNGAINLVGVMLALSGIYALLDSPFLAVLQVLVYAGAIMMLVVFVIMVLNQAKDHRVPGFDWLAITTLALPTVIGFLVVKTVRIDLPAAADAQRAGAEVLAPRLFDVTAGGPGYYLLFELIGILLLVAVVAAVLLAKRSLDTPELDTHGETVAVDAKEETHGAH